MGSRPPRLARSSRSPDRRPLRPPLIPQGRPNGPEDKFRLAPVFKRLTELLKVPVVYVDDCVGPKVAAAVAAAPDGSVVLLENVRFYKEEEENEAGFAKTLAGPAALYVNDAFGTAHRAHASTEGVTKFLKPCVAGFLLQKELDYLARRGGGAQRARLDQGRAWIGLTAAATSPRWRAPAAF